TEICSAKRLSGPTVSAKRIAELDRHWNKAIERCLEFDPAQRFDRADRFLRTVEGHSLRRMAAVAGAFGILLIAIALVGWRLGVRREKSLAVLPMNCIVITKEDDEFCRGLGGFLTARLASLEVLQNSFWMTPATEVRSTGARTVRDARRALG